jgi:sugar lactone lactonase YvrE
MDVRPPGRPKGEYRSAPHGGSPSVRLAVDARDRLGECALRCERNSALYWTDIEGCTIRCLQADGQVREWTLPEEVGSFALEPGWRGLPESRFVPAR